MSQPDPQITEPDYHGGAKQLKTKEQRQMFYDMVANTLDDFLTAEDGFSKSTLLEDTLAKLGDWMEEPLTWTGLNAALQQTLAGDKHTVQRLGIQTYWSKPAQEEMRKRSFSNGNEDINAIFYRAFELASEGKTETKDVESTKIFTANAVKELKGEFASYAKLMSRFGLKEETEQEYRARMIRGYNAEEHQNDARDESIRGAFRSLSRDIEDGFVFHAADVGEKANRCHIMKCKERLEQKMQKDGVAENDRTSVLSQFEEHMNAAYDRVLGPRQTKPYICLPGELAQYL